MSLIATPLRSLLGILLLVCQCRGFLIIRGRRLGHTEEGLRLIFVNVIVWVHGRGLIWL
jgi:hypothetical protein